MSSEDLITVVMHKRFLAELEAWAEQRRCSLALVPESEDVYVIIPAPDLVSSGYLAQLRTHWRTMFGQTARPTGEVQLVSDEELRRKQYVQDNAYPPLIFERPVLDEDGILRGYEQVSPTEAGTPPAPSASDLPPSPGSAPTG